MSQALCRLLSDGDHCDIVLTCCGERFPAHRLALAATSCVWRERLQSVQDLEVPVTEVSQPEAVRLMVSAIYDADSLERSYDPGSSAVNQAVLVLAKCFELPQLSELAMHWLAKDVTTANVVDKLRVCRQFQLETLHSGIIQQLIGNRAALTEVSRSAQIARYPELMQALLQRAAAHISLEASAGRERPATAAEKFGELGEQPTDRVGEESVGVAFEERRAIDEPADSFEEKAIDEAGERGTAPMIRRRRSVGKQSEDRVTAEESVENVADEVAVGVMEEGPKKRQKKGPGK